MLLLAAGVVLLSAALAHSYFALLEAPWLKVREIQALGLKHVERKQVLNAVMVPRGTSIFGLKMRELASKVEALAWVKSAVVRLDLPGRMVVEVVEREPMALVQAEDVFLMDTEGKLFARAGGAYDRQELLLFTGFSGLGLHEGSHLPSEALDDLRELLAALDKKKGWLPVGSISECRWSAGAGFQILPSQIPAPVHLGLDDYELKLDRLHRVIGLLQERQWSGSVTLIDLDYSNRAYIEGQFGAPKDG